MFTRQIFLNSLLLLTLLILVLFKISTTEAVDTKPIYSTTQYPNLDYSTKQALDFLYHDESKAWIQNEFNIDITGKQSVFIQVDNLPVDPIVGVEPTAKFMPESNQIILNKKLVDIACNEPWTTEARKAQEILERIIGHELIHWADYIEDKSFKPDEEGLKWENDMQKYFKWDPTHGWNPEQGFLPPDWQQGNPRNPYPIPEPSILFLLGSGLAGVVGLRRKSLLK